MVRKINYMSLTYIMADAILDKPSKDVTDDELKVLGKHLQYLRSNKHIFDKIADVHRIRDMSKIVPRFQPTDTEEYFVEALRNKNFPLILSLAEQNNTYKCFLQEYINKIKACAKKTYDCIQDVIDKMFVKNIKDYNFTCVKLLLKIGVNK